MNIVELLKEYRMRRDDLNYIYNIHGKNGVHIDKYERVNASDKAKFTRQSIENLAVGLADIIDNLDSQIKYSLDAMKMALPIVEHSMCQDIDGSATGFSDAIASDKLRKAIEKIEFSKKAGEL